MPIPNPEKDESQKDFIGRCAGIMKEEFPDNKQRLAVCFSTWRKSKKDSENFLDSVDRNIKFNIDSNSSLRFDENTGFLYGKARVTRSGVFDYYDSDGNLMRELRSPEEVFDKSSMDSLALKPIVDDHTEMITVDNIKEFQVGSIGDTIERDGMFLLSNIVITDKEMVETILNRKTFGLSTELSCGYSCQLVPDIGIHDSEGYYTFKQKNIRYNHVAIVDKARAGKEVKILDKQDKQKQNKKELEMPDKVQFTRKAINLDSFKVDAISGQFDNDSINIITSFSEKLDEAANVIVSINKDKDSLQGKLDQANETINNLNTKVESLNNIDSEEVVSMFNDRAKVLDIAAKLEVDCKDKKINEIKIDCIKKISENFDATNKSTEYINARFDSISDIINIKNDKEGKETFSSFMKNVNDACKSGTKSNPRDEFIKKNKEKSMK